MRGERGSIQKRENFMGHASRSISRVHGHCPTLVFVLGATVLGLGRGLMCGDMGGGSEGCAC